MKKSLLKILLLSISVAFSTLHAQTKHQDLNSPENIDRLFKINQVRVGLEKQLKDCQKTYNTTASKINKSLDSINKIVVSMGVESKEFVSHNQDLQAGLLGMIEENEKLTRENIKLKASKSKNFVVGPGGTYDLFTGRFSGGPTVVFKLFSF